MELLDNRLSVQEKTSLHSSPCQCITEVLYFWTVRNCSGTWDSRDCKWCLMPVLLAQALKQHAGSGGSGVASMDRHLVPYLPTPTVDVKEGTEAAD